jgi:predicted AAA+ superfamily ATPase
MAMNTENRGGGRLISPGGQTVLPALADLAGLTLFKDCKRRPLLRAFRLLLEEWAGCSPDPGFAAPGGAPGKTFQDNSPRRQSPPLSLLRRWAALVRELGAGDGDFSSRLRELALGSDNPFTLGAERGEEGRSDTFPARLAEGDLNRLGRLAAFDIPALGFAAALYLRSWGLEEAAAALEAEARSLWQVEGRERARQELPGPPVFPDSGGAGVFPPEGSTQPWGASLEAFAAQIRRHGAGVLGRRGFFRWTPSSGSPRTPGTLRPVLNPDPVSLADLSGYRDQRAVVAGNTLSLLEGAANNLLLYGDRGTGKSATVKAVCREYLDRGLRLLELRKEDAAELPAVLEFTASRGLKFVVFIDDLSFEDLNDSFTGLKTLLEGGVEARPQNTVIYAASNRRHLVREHPADRPASPGNEDLRSFDTMQEQLSMADRFGLTVFFSAPSREEYLETARFIAERRGLKPDGGFRERALRWEQWFNGRSPRTASQFVDWLKGGKPFPWD